MPYRNKKYLQWIQSQPCEICNGKSEPHHIRKERWGAGMGQKPHDYVAIPLCRKHHDPAIEKLIKVEYLIIENLMRYIEHVR
jgi:hypothetical protein